MYGIPDRDAVPALEDQDLEIKKQLGTVLKENQRGQPKRPQGTSRVFLGLQLPRNLASCVLKPCGGILARSEFNNYLTLIESKERRRENKIRKDEREGPGWEEGFPSWLDIVRTHQARGGAGDLVSTPPHLGVWNTPLAWLLTYAKALGR